MKRILLRLATLWILVAGLVFFATDRPEYTAHASDYEVCDSGFTTCNNSCTPSTAVPCYGDCQYDYHQCLYNAGDQYSRTPIIDPSQSCWDNAVSVYNHCVIGMMPGQSSMTPDYAGIYASCMATYNDPNECCGHVQAEWWQLNGPWCY